MRLLSLEVENFRAIRSATLTFGRGLNVIHGPNDLGKSTLTETIRAALLVAPASAEARAFASWSAVSGERPRVVLTFECQGATWKVEKVFGTGTKAKAYLEKSTDGGTRYHTHAEGRDVEGRIRELLSWGLPAPGGRGPAQRTETYLTTALLGKQGGVSAIFDVTLKDDLDGTGRALVTRALNALGQDPLVTRLLERLKARSEEAFTAGGRHKRSADSPLVRARDELKEREDRLRELEETARQGSEIEEQARRLLQARDVALEARDRAEVELHTLREQVAAADKRQQLDLARAGHLREFQRVTTALTALETARQDYATAQGAVTVAAEEQTKAAEAASIAAAGARAASDRLARAQSAHESAGALTSSARELRVSDIRAGMVGAAARKKSVQEVVAARTELIALESQLASARAALDEAQREVARAAADEGLSTGLEELRRARLLTAAVDEAGTEHERQLARERAAAAVVAAAEAALTAAATTADQARSSEEQARRVADEDARSVGLLETRILHSEAASRDERDALERAKIAQLRVRRADETEAALAAAEAIVAGIEDELAANAAEIARRQTELRELESVGLELRRRVLVSQVDDLVAQENAALEKRRFAVEAREKAARQEAEAVGAQLPASQQLTDLHTLQTEIQRRKEHAPTVPSRSVLLPLLGGIVGAVIGFVAVRYGAAAGTSASISAALVAGIAAALTLAGFGSRRQEANELRIWHAETDRLEAQLETQTAALLGETDVGRSADLEAKRRRLETRRGDAEQLRAEAVNFDREADALLARSTGLLQLQRELGTLIDDLAAHDSDALTSRAVLFAEGQAVLGDAVRAQRERIEQAHRVEQTLRTQRDEQSARCAGARAQRESAVAERGEITDAKALASAVVAAESRWREAQTQLDGLQQERQRLAGRPSAPSPAGFEIALSTARSEVLLAESNLGNARQDRQAVVDNLARAAARLELARRDADAVNLNDLERRVTAAHVAAGQDVIPSGIDAARLRYEQAKERVSSVAATVDHLNAGLVSARRKVDALAWPPETDPANELVNAENDARRLEAELVEAQTESAAQQVSSSEHELRDAEQASALAEQSLIVAQERAGATTTRRDDLRATADRARGDVEACERQAQGMNFIDVERALTEARDALAELPAVPVVTTDALAQGERCLEDRDHELKACESVLNEARGKLALVAGKVGLERIDDERDAVARAKEYAEDQEFEYEASRHLLASLEAAELTRASHLGRSLAAPVAERFLALTGDLYAHVDLDPDLRLEGIVASGGTRGVAELSVGTREQLATIVRLAIAAQIKTTVLLDDQLVHSDSRRLEWFRRQLRNSVREHDHQVIVVTCRLSDYSEDEERLGPETEPVPEGPAITIIDVRDVVQRC